MTSGNPILSVQRARNVNLSLLKIIEFFDNSIGEQYDELIKRKKIKRFGNNYRECQITANKNFFCKFGKFFA